MWNLYNCSKVYKYTILSQELDLLDSYNGELETPLAVSMNHYKFTNHWS